jgi:cell division protein FtsL
MKNISKKVLMYSLLALVLSVSTFLVYKNYFSENQNKETLIQNNEDLDEENIEEDIMGDEIDENSDIYIRNILYMS